MNSKDELTLKIDRSRERWKSFRWVFGWLSVVGICYVIMKALQGMAGTSTSLSVMFQAITDLKMNQWFGLVVGGGGSLWAFGERGFRKKETKRLSEEIDKLQRLIDPNKESSGLTKMGNTPEGHK